MASVQLNAPGVPPLLGGVTITLPPLLSADTFTRYGVPGELQWGVFLGGAPVVTFDTFVSIDYRQGWALSDYPVERGGFQTYDKVQLPFDVRVKFAAGGSEANRAALLSSVAAVARSLLLYDVVTPEKTYSSVNVQHYDYHRTSTNGVGLLVVEMWLLEVRVTSNAQQDNTGANGQPVDATGQPITGQDGSGLSGAGNNVNDASAANPVDSGNVTPQPPSDSATSGFDAGVVGAGGGGGGGF